MTYTIDMVQISFKPQDTILLGGSLRFIFPS